VAVSVLSLYGPAEAPAETLMTGPLDGEASATRTVATKLVDPPPADCVLVVIRMKSRSVQANGITVDRVISVPESVATPAP
jgi:hypothetical protein